MKIKAIETEYNGYRFRSRLEARWAVFFDAAKIRYEYEPEGFEIDDGERYLPDFYLPQYQLYIEIKPSSLDKNQREIAEEKCRKFRDIIGKAIFISNGDPSEDFWGKLFAWDLCDSSGGTYEEYARFIPLGEYYHPDIVLLTFGGRLDRMVFVTANYDKNKKVITEGMLCDYYPNDALFLLHANMNDLFDPQAKEGTFDYMRKQARQARFEHGEKPKV